MKTTTIYSAFTVLAVVTLLSSCAFLQKGEFAQRKYYDFPRTKHSEVQAASVHGEKNSVAPVCIATSQSESGTVAPVFSASVNERVRIAPVKSRGNTKHISQRRASKNEKTIAPAFAVSFKKSDIKKEARKLSNHFSYSDAGIMLFIMVLAAIFVPPLGIYIKDHRTNKWFWITLILCIAAGGFFFVSTLPVGVAGLCWLLAVIFALMDVFDLL